MTAKPRKKTVAIEASFRTVTGPGYTLIHGDCAAVLATIAPESVDAIVTDPPAGISFMGREWDGDKGGRNQWIAWLADIMRKAIVTLKPGGHALVWALPRTSHWTATAVEDAGFEIRDVGIHLFGTGFPKSLDVSKAIDAALGAERDVSPTVPMMRASAVGSISRNLRCAICEKPRQASDPCRCPRDSGPATPDAARFAGVGTALKPAAEHWILARKPLIGTVAANAMQFGTGGLNIDACRIEGIKDVPASASGNRRAGSAEYRMGAAREGTSGMDPSIGRWPANVSLDEDAAAGLDEQAGPGHDCRGGATRNTALGRMNDDGWKPKTGTIARAHDKGGVSRFFYVAKCAASDRTCGGEVDNDHPTVKSRALMRWLVRLVTPPGGLVLDLFAGSGSTALACIDEGARFVGFENDAQPGAHSIAVARIATALAGSAPMERAS